MPPVGSGTSSKSRAWSRRSVRRRHCRPPWLLSDGCRNLNLIRKQVNVKTRHGGPHGSSGPECCDTRGGFECGAIFGLKILPLVARPRLVDGWRPVHQFSLTTLARGSNCVWRKHLQPSCPCALPPPPERSEIMRLGACLFDISSRSRCSASSTASRPHPPSRRPVTALIWQAASTGVQM